MREVLKGVVHAAIAGVTGAMAAIFYVRLLINREAASHGHEASEGAQDDREVRRPSVGMVPLARSVSVRSTTTYKRVQKFVLTGGPCGGKTTALARLREFLEERGFRVYVAPEAATTLWSNGMRVTDLKSDRDGEQPPRRMHRLFASVVHPLERHHRGTAVRSARASDGTLYCMFYLYVCTLRVYFRFYTLCSILYVRSARVSDGAHEDADALRGLLRRACRANRPPAPTHCLAPPSSEPRPAPPGRSARAQLLLRGQTSYVYETVLSVQEPSYCILYTLYFILYTL